MFGFKFRFGLFNSKPKSEKMDARSKENSSAADLARKILDWAKAMGRKLMRHVKTVLDWIIANPYQTMFIVATGILTVTACVYAVPAVLAAMGFGTGGIVAGSIAAAIMSFFGTVSAGGLFAILQSAAMGGYGLPIVTAVAVIVGLAIFALGVWAWLK